MRNLIFNGEVKNLYVEMVVDCLDKNEDYVMIGYNATTKQILITKDFLNTEKYLSTKDYILYKQQYSDEDGLGKFYDIYEKEGSEMWEIIGEYKNGSMIMNEKSLEMFNKHKVNCIFMGYHGWDVKF